jgi:drug/metabolite transporter (DMT)-like permease
MNTPAVARPRWAVLLLLAVVVFGWGCSWVVIKLIVLQMPPIWASALRSVVGCAGLLVLLLARGQFILPRRGDLAVIIVSGLFHSIAFSLLISFGLKYVPAGRSIVLGYTTPLWVAPGAWLLLGETMPRLRLLGIAVGLLGLLTLFNPFSFDWHDHAALTGNALIVTAALCWSVSILYVRAHRWVSSPFQVMFWQTMLANIVMVTLAAIVEGLPRITWTPSLIAELAYGGLVASALAFWAMHEVNRRLPATTTSLCILATPVVGIVTSAVFLHEAIDPPLIVATLLILGGIAIGTVRRAGSQGAA